MAKLRPHDFNPRWASLFVDAIQAAQEQLPAEVVAAIVQWVALMIKEDAERPQEEPPAQIQLDEFGAPKTKIWVPEAPGRKGYYLPAFETRPRATLLPIALVSKQWLNPVRRILFQKVRCNTARSFKGFCDSATEDSSSSISFQPLCYLRELTLQRRLVDDREAQQPCADLLHQMAIQCHDKRIVRGATLTVPRPLRVTLDRVFLGWLTKALRVEMLARDRRFVEHQLETVSNPRVSAESLRDALCEIDHLIQAAQRTDDHNDFVFNTSCLSNICIEELIIDGTADTSGEQPGHALPQVDFMVLAEFMSRVKGLNKLIVRHVNLVGAQSRFMRPPPAVESLKEFVVDRAFWLIDASRQMRPAFPNLKAFTIDGRGKREDFMYKFLHEWDAREDRYRCIGANLESLSVLWSHAIWNDFVHLSNKVMRFVLLACPKLTSLEGDEVDTWVNTALLIHDMPPNLVNLTLRGVTKKVATELYRDALSQRNWLSQLQSLVLVVGEEHWDEQLLNDIGERCRERGVKVTVNGDVYGSDRWPHVQRRRW